MVCKRCTAVADNCPRTIAACLLKSNITTDSPDHSSHRRYSLKKLEQARYEMSLTEALAGAASAAGGGKGIQISSSAMVDDEDEAGGMEVGGDGEAGSKRGRASGGKAGGGAKKARSNEKLLVYFKFKALFGCYR